MGARLVEHQGGDPTGEIYPYPDQVHAGPTETKRGFTFGAREIVVAVVVLGLVAVGGYFGVSALLRDEPFTVEGTLQLNTASITTAGLPPGFNCAGSAGYRDVGPGAPVTVSDEAGTLLAKSTLSGSVGGPGWCALSFSVEDVPAGSKFYRVEVARRGDMSYTEEEARGRVGLTLGDEKPEVGPAAPVPPPSQNPSPPPAARPPAAPRPARPCTGRPGTADSACVFDAVYLRWRVRTIQLRSGQFADLMCFCRGCPLRVRHATSARRNRSRERVQPRDAGDLPHDMHRQRRRHVQGRERRRGVSVLTSWPTSRRSPTAIRAFTSTVHARASRIDRPQKLGPLTES
jgi:hypothetical protein